jgi:hypothetical protein
VLQCDASHLLLSSPRSQSNPARLDRSSAAALDSRSVHTILQRQLSPSSVPEACQSTCQSTFTIYNACLNGDQTTCLGVCQAGTFSEVVSDRLTQCIKSQELISDFMLPMCA